jgi:hypothetical protein
MQANDAMVVVTKVERDDRPKHRIELYFYYVTPNYLLCCIGCGQDIFPDC